MAWLNKDVATIIRDSVDDPMTYGRLLCTSKLFGHNENLEIKLRMVRGAIQQLEYELSPKRPKTAFGRYKATSLQARCAYPMWSTKEDDVWVDTMWRNLSEEEREVYRLCNVQERDRFNRAVTNLRFPGHESQLKARIRSAKTLERYLRSQMPRHST